MSSLLNLIQNLEEEAEIEQSGDWISVRKACEISGLDGGQVIFTTEGCEVDTRTVRGRLLLNKREFLARIGRNPDAPLPLAYRPMKVKKSYAGKSASAILDSWRIALNPEGRYGIYVTINRETNIRACRAINTLELVQPDGSVTNLSLNPTADGKLFKLEAMCKLKNEMLDHSK